MDTGSLDRKRKTRDKWWVATAVLPGQLTVAFGMFGVVVVLPNLITAFGTDVQTVQWVMTGYLVARVVPMPAMGWLVNQLGQRNVYAGCAWHHRVDGARCRRRTAVWAQGYITCTAVLRWPLASP